MSSPMMKRIFGLRPEGADGAVGTACCACARIDDEETDVAAMAAPASRTLRRFGGSVLRFKATVLRGSLDDPFVIFSSIFNSVGLRLPGRNCGRTKRGISRPRGQRIFRHGKVA